MAIIDNLVASWELNEASGDAVDAHSNGLNLTDTNTVGTSGGWRDFERDSSQYFTRASEANLVWGDEPMTIIADVELESKPAAVDMCIVQKTTGGNGEYFFQYRNNGSEDRLAFAVFGSAGFGNFGITLADSLSSPSTGVPYFIVGWHDPTNDVIGIQVNDGTEDTEPHSAGIYGSGTGNFELSGFEFSNFWDGRIRRVRMWRRVLTAPEKTWLYNSGTGRTYAEIVAGMGSSDPSFRVNALRPNAFAPGFGR